MAGAEFVHLHLHTQYSLLDGAIRPDDLMGLVADRDKMPAVACTDHGNLFGAVEFYEAAKKKGVKPIIGVEIYVAPRSRLEKQSNGTREGANHLVLLAMNDAGYSNLCKLVSKAYLEGYYYKPRVDRELLELHNEGLIALSACLSGEINTRLMRGERKEAVQAAGWHKEVFSDGRFYIEVQENGLLEQDKCNGELIRIAKETGVPLVATNDAHYLTSGHVRAHEILLCIGTATSISDAKRLKFHADHLYVKTPEEMAHAFRHLPEAVARTMEIAEKCNFEMRFGEYQFPRVDLGEGETLDSALDRAARQGLQQRLDEIRRLEGEGFEGRMDEYERRLATEIEVIKTTGFAGYFLIVSDFVRYAKKKGIPVGPGRGSAAGSLVAYCLDITDVNPLPYNLLFERFLNPERVSMPDIDMDFCRDRRDEVLQYVTEKYGGSDYVAQIITFGKMQAKAVVRDVGRALGMPYGDVDKIAKLVPNKLNITLDDAIASESRFGEMMKADPKVAELIDMAKALEGLTRHASTHAAGVVIGDRPLMETLPLYKDQAGHVVTQFSMNHVEKVGLIKFDFLGLKTLTVIDHAEKMISRRLGRPFSIRDVPMDDKPSYDLLCSGDTTGVFQLESSGMREILVKLHPSRFEDVIALVALYRPGPLESGMVDDFIACKHGRKEIAYPLPQLRDVLEETYGVILYQEQVMKIASVLAGYSLGEADILRRAMGKKKAEEMAKQRSRFLEGCAERNIPKGKAEHIFDLMEKFAGYGFNKSHSAAYALVAYQTAYLKAHYPVEFFAALLTCDMSDTDKVIRYIAECRGKRIEVLAPDVNESDLGFSVVDGKIRFALAGVKGAGEGAIQAVLDARKKGGPFKTLADFCERVEGRKANRKTVESLVKAGAFDSIHPSRAAAVAGLEAAIEIGSKAQRDRESGQLSIFGALGGAGAAPEESFALPEVPEWKETDRLRAEKEALGFYITGHPLAKYAGALGAVSSVTTDRLKDKAAGAVVKLACVIAALKERTSGKGDKMASLTLEDQEGSVEAVVFPRVYEQVRDLLGLDAPVLVEAKVEIAEETARLIVQGMTLLSDAIEKGASAVVIRLDEARVRGEQVAALKALLARHPGPCSVRVRLERDGVPRAERDLGGAYRVATTAAFSEALDDLLGYPALELRGA